MVKRLGIACVGLALAAATLPTAAMAGEMTPTEARHFVVGKLFSFSCFDGTRGAGRITHDGSVVGTVQMSGSGPLRRAALPAGTLQVRGEKVCASLKGLLIEPCFNLVKTSDHSFRGAISGFGFAYCDFVKRGHGRNDMMRTATRSHNRPLALRATVSE
ncbi:MAG: hypothetical protein AB7K64_11765 [Variibacter sp.]